MVWERQNIVETFRKMLGTFKLLVFSRNCERQVLLPKNFYNNYLYIINSENLNFYNNYLYIINSEIQILYNKN